MVHVVELGASEGYLVKSRSRTRVVEELDASEVFGFVVVIGVRRWRKTNLAVLVDLVLGVISGSVIVLGVGRREGT